MLNDIFKKYSPEKVFHSAAYKHVNIVEKNHIEALKNNTSDISTERQRDVVLSSNQHLGTLHPVHGPYF